VTEDDARKRLLDVARGLLGIPFPRREAGERSGLLDLTKPSPTLSCSQFVRQVVDGAFGPDYWLRLIEGDYASVAVDGGARTMWAHLEPADPPAVGDLQFFGDDESDDWHVMMVAGTATLIGAIPGDSVREVHAARFSDMKAQGARRMPLPEPDDPKTLPLVGWGALDR
jgi:hypothetical protein